MPLFKVVEGVGFEPTNPKGADLQSAAFSHFATPPFYTFFNNYSMKNNNEVKCRRRDLNPQPTDYKSVALPIELHRQIEKWLETESNRRHEDFQSSALPTELSSHEWRRRRDSNPRRPQKPLAVFKTAPFSQTWVLLQFLIKMDLVGLEPTTGRL